MKTTKIYTPGLMFLAVLFASNSFAQKDLRNDLAYKSPSLTTTKNVTSFKKETPITAQGEAINEAIVNSFRSNYGNAEGVLWSKVGNRYLAKFRASGRATECLFNKHGKLVYSIEQRSQANMPADVKALITKAYGSYSISYVANVKKNNREIWVVTLAGQKNDVRARVENGKLEEVETLKKV